MICQLQFVVIYFYMSMIMIIMLNFTFEEMREHKLTVAAAEL